MELYGCRVYWFFVSTVCSFRIFLLIYSVIIPELIPETCSETRTLCTGELQKLRDQCKRSSGNLSRKIARKMWTTVGEAFQRNPNNMLGRKLPMLPRTSKDCETKNREDWETIAGYSWVTKLKRNVAEGCATPRRKTRLLQQPFAPDKTRSGTNVENSWSNSHLPQTIERNKLKQIVSVELLPGPRNERYYKHRA